MIIINGLIPKNKEICWWGANVVKKEKIIIRVIIILVTWLIVKEIKEIRGKYVKIKLELQRLWWKGAAMSFMKLKCELIGSRDIRIIRE